MMMIVATKIITSIILKRGRCVGTLVTSSGMQRWIKGLFFANVQALVEIIEVSIVSVSVGVESRPGHPELWSDLSLMWFGWFKPCRLCQSWTCRLNILGSPRFLARSLEMRCGRSTLTERLLFNIPWIGTSSSESNWDHFDGSMDNWTTMDNWYAPMLIHFDMNPRCSSLSLPGGCDPFLFVRTRCPALLRQAASGMDWSDCHIVESLWHIKDIYPEITGIDRSKGSTPT